jgi:KUP system potassium uptake protein
MAASKLSDVPEGADITAFEGEAGHEEAQGEHKSGLAMLTIGAVGVVYGDIGTSPLYALREALRPVAADGLTRFEVFGVLSLLIWSLTMIVTLKYVAYLLRADNRGEGGVLALYTLSRLAIGRRSLWVLGLGIAGASLFLGDSVITPAISVLSAVEGIGLVAPAFGSYVVPVTVGILLGLFFVQKHGTAEISSAFGPIMVVWFLVMAGTGIVHLVRDPEVLWAFDPVFAVTFLIRHGFTAFIVLGAVFLAVTGAEALYADLGHFGKAPIRLAWLCLIFPALVLQYLGQGALVLADPKMLENPFFLMVPDWALPLLVGLATVATIIAAQAVITGAYSMARAGIALGLLPRMAIVHTSERQSGQIYIPSVNWLLLGGVLFFVLSFRSSSALASAYGIAVTGAMLVDTTLGIIYSRRGWRMPIWLIAIGAIPFVALEGTFFLSNLTKVPEGGYIPLLLAFTFATIMWTWWRGTQLVMARESREKVDMDGFAHSIADSATVKHVDGTAFFLTSDPSAVPQALLHNLKHNRVLHEKNVILTVETMRIPVAPEEERVEYAPIDEHFSRLRLRFGFMETPNLSRALGLARRHGLKFDVMTTSFFLGRRKLIMGTRAGYARILDRIYITLGRFAADPSEFYHLPRDRVVELGSRITV